MKTKKFKSIKALHEACKFGEVDETKLHILIDNDDLIVYECPCNFEDFEDCTEIKIDGYHGYADVEDLWKLVFPSANVSWV